MDNKDKGGSVSSKKRESNRRNAQLSTGPKTEVGKKHSRLNALTHGVLATVLVVTDGNWEYPDQFEELLRALARDLRPAGTLEEMLVEKIARCWWRQQRALRFEARKINEESESTVIVGDGEEFSLPLERDLNRILRYEASIQRQLVHAINQLERMQRARKGEDVPPPVSVHVSGDL